MEGRCFSQHSTNGMSPRMLGSRYTMPQRDTVAGEATARSCTSNIMVIAWCQGRTCKPDSYQPPSKEERYGALGVIACPSCQKALWAVIGRTGAAAEVQGIPESSFDNLALHRSLRESQSWRVLDFLANVEFLGA